MKVGVNALFLIPKEVGGTETYLLEILSASLGLYPHIHFVIFTNLENDPIFRSLFEGDRRVTMHLLKFSATNRFVRIIREQIELPLKIKKSGIDLLWSPGITAPYACSVPQVVTIHDMVHARYPEDLTFLARTVTHGFVSMAVHRSQLILTPSQFSKKEIAAYFRIPEDRIFVTYEAASRTFDPLVKKVDHEMTPPDFSTMNRPYILCVANSYPHKNVPRLVEAFEIVANDIPHQLVIIGHPRPLGEEDLQTAIKKSSHTERITRFTYVSTQDLLWCYQHADLFVFPSLYEGFGLPVLEAMMTGIPVLTTACGSIPEIASECVRYFDGRNAQELAEQIKAVLGLAPDQKQRLIEKAKQKAMEFSWEQTAEKTMACFEAILNKKVIDHYLDDSC